MRKIEQQMLGAIAQRRNWQSGNTQVTTVRFSCGGARSEIYLHGNHIANVWTGADDPLPNLWVNRETLADWPTPTTKSRLRALCADVCHRNNRLYLDGLEVEA